MSENNDSTRSFDALDQNSKKSEPKTARQKLIASIFVVIILLLVSFAVLIFGQIFSQIWGGSAQTTTSPNGDSDQIYMDSEDIRSGMLLLLNDSFNYLYPTERDDLVTVYNFKNDAANDGATKISANGKTYPTYELGSLATSIVLSRETLDAFNKMMHDFCATLDLSSLAEGSNASNINLAWGYSDPDSLVEDLDTSKSFHDHALATAVTLRRNSDSAAITESMLKSEYKWIYDNCYKYGFILRYPTDKADKTGLDGSARIHLRYVGYEHAYYMNQNGLCLEEYLELIRTQYIHTGEHLTFTADNGTTYEVYYVACSGNPTTITVPKGALYSVSGDNMSGFIVTITK